MPAVQSDDAGSRQCRHEGRRATIPCIPRGGDDDHGDEVASQGCSDPGIPSLRRSRDDDGRIQKLRSRQRV